MTSERLLKPHYLFRPSQALRRLARTLDRGPLAPTVVRLPWGLPLRVDPREDVGRAIWQLGLHDLAVCEALWRLTSPGDLAVDVGANLGQMTGLLALRAGTGGRVLSFEPHPEVFADLAANVDLFRSDPRIAPIEVSRAAVAASAGTAWLDPGQGFAANHGLARLADAPGSGLPVETTTLDTVLAGRSAAIVKVDVEGREEGVLRGARRSLRERRIRHLILEAGSGEERLSLANALEGLGYVLFSLGRGFRGLLLTPLNERPRLPAWEAPSCLATNAPQEVFTRLRPRGWQVLSRAAAH